MKKLLSAVALMMTASFMTGCTSWAGISQADKPGSYYLLKNKNMGFLGIHTAALLCKSDPKSGNLDCKQVDVANE